MDSPEVGTHLTIADRPCAIVNKRGRCPDPATWLFEGREICTRHHARYRYNRRQQAAARAANEQYNVDQRLIAKVQRLVPGHDWAAKLELLERTAALMIAWSMATPDMNRLNILLDNVVPVWNIGITHPETRQRLSGVSTP